VFSSLPKHFPNQKLIFIVLLKPKPTQFVELAQQSNQTKKLNSHPTIEMLGNRSQMLLGSQPYGQPYAYTPGSSV